MSCHGGGQGPKRQAGCRAQLDVGATALGFVLVSRRLQRAGERLEREGRYIAIVITIQDSTTSTLLSIWQ
jgi:hypothetical protein